MNNDNYNKIFSDYPDCVTIKQLQNMLNIGRNSAYKLLKNESIQTKRVGNLYLIPKVNVIKFLLNDNNAVVN